jgi:hypothetical protein
MRAFAVACAALLAGLAGGCAGSTFDRHFDARRWDAAARAFDADTALHGSERALYRAAVVHATPGTAVYDPQRARALLERLLEIRSSGGRSLEASLLLALLHEVERQDSARLALQREAERRIARLATEIARLEDELRSTAERHTANMAEASQLRALAAALRTELRQRENRMQELQRELDRLKEIDLSPPPKPPGRDGGVRR